MDITIFQAKGKSHTACEDTALAGKVLAQGASRVALSEMTYPIVAAAMDGVGGAAGGRFASEFIASWVRDMPLNEALTTDEFRDLLLEGDKKLRKEAARTAEKTANAEFSRMGTTVAGCCFLSDDSPRMLVFWAGNSRVYKVTKDAVRLISEDHTDEFGRLTGGFGGGGGGHFADRLRVEELVCDKASRYLITTDGVHDHISNKEIFQKILMAGCPEQLFNISDETDDRTVMWIEP